MGILDSIVEWFATQVMNLLDLVNSSVLGALGCDMSTFLRYFPAAETLYSVFVAIAIGYILLNVVWQLFRNYGVGVGIRAEDPIKLTIKSIRFSIVHPVKSYQRNPKSVRCRHCNRTVRILFPYRRSWLPIVLT